MRKKIFEQLKRHIEFCNDTTVTNQAGEVTERAITINEEPGEERLLGCRYSDGKICLFGEDFKELLELTEDHPLLYILEEIFSDMAEGQQ